jgi:hypothetical protein
MKSHAVLCDGSGMPGVSGDENVYRPRIPAAILAGAAKLAGVVPTDPVAGFPPSGGRGNGNDASLDSEAPTGAYVDMSQILFGSTDLAEVVRRSRA